MHTEKSSIKSLRNRSINININYAMQASVYPFHSHFHSIFMSFLIVVPEDFNPHSLGCYKTLTHSLRSHSFETTNHLFIDCDLTRIIWRQSKWPLSISTFTDFPITCWINIIFNPFNSLNIPKKRRFSTFNSLPPLH
jgi:hypothetical protein